MGWMHQLLLTATTIGGDVSMTMSLLAPRLAPVPKRYTAAYPRGGRTRFTPTPLSPTMLAFSGSDRTSEYSSK